MEAQRKSRFISSESLPEGANLTVTGAGRCQLDMNACFYHVRVCFEDNLKYNRERNAISNAEFVNESSASQRANLEIAMPEARQILGMPERAK